MTNTLNLPAASRTLQIAAVLAALTASPVAAQRPVPVRLDGVSRQRLVFLTDPGARPTGLRAGSTPTSIKLIWNCPQGATGYDVYATPRGGVSIKLTPTPLTLQCYQNLSLSIPNDPRLPAVPGAAAQTSYMTSFTHVGLTPTAEFAYVVRALHPNGVADSDPFTVRALWPAPSGFMASLQDRSASLRWNPVTGPAGYLVFRRMEGQSGFQPMTAAPLAATSFNDNTSLPPGQHAYYVQAVNGEPSATATVLLGAWPASPPAPKPAPAPASTARWAKLNPAIHGFRFVNNFKNSFMPPPINVETSGLCGGMSYAVLDYYYSGRPIATQTYRPANNTPLQQYLYGRQVTSLLQNLDKWAEVGVNPGGARNTEFFNWGLTARLVELRAFIDRGVPVPLGLKGIGAILERSDHQVLAIGYNMGRYAGDLGNFKEDLKIYLLDPNYPTETVTLVPDLAANVFYELEHPSNRWRTYFVDGKYVPMTPLNIVNPSYPSDGLVHELLFAFYTGPAFDLRGGADHVDLAITLSDNTSQSYPNISQDGRWLKDYAETAQVILSRPVPRAMIQSITISTNAPGGLNSANWDMQSVEVTAVGGGGFPQKLLVTPSGPYLFTGVRPSLVIQVK
jgi:hypothetical protein